VKAPAHRRAVIAGVATSDYPYLPDLSEHAVHGQAADRALADAGLTFADVDGLATAGTDVGAGDGASDGSSGAAEAGGPSAAWAWATG